MQEPGDAVRLELHEQVDVAVGSELSSKRGAEQAKAPHPVGATERLQGVVNRDSRSQVHVASVAAIGTPRTDRRRPSRAIAPIDGVKGRSGAPLALRSSLGCAHP